MQGQQVDFDCAKLICGQLNHHKWPLPKRTLGKAYEFENQIPDCCENITKSNRSPEPLYIDL